MDWIDVKKNLPMPQFEVLICDSNGFVTCGWYSFDGYWYNDQANDAGKTLTKITHWMSMPSPPKIKTEIW